MQKLTTDEMARRLGRSLRQVQRDLKAFSVLPVDFDGRTQLYAPEQVEQLKEAKRLARVASLSPARGLPTMRELRRERVRAQWKAGAQ